MATRIGVDIGGTKVAVGVVDEAGEILREERFPTTTFDASIERLLGVIAELRQEDTDGIGMGCPGPLDPVGGTVLRADNLDGWDGHNLIEPVRQATGLPVALENDADAALVGEIHSGAFDRTQVTVMLTFGTGIGGAIWTGRGIYRGAFGEHPELGHFTAIENGPSCYCGTQGCLEQVAAGPAIWKMATAAGFADAPEYLVKGDLTVLRQAIGRVLWTLAHTFRPATVILGGGVMEAHFHRLVPFQELTPDTAPMLLQPMRVVPATLGNRAGMVGAARLVDLL